MKILKQYLLATIALVLITACDEDLKLIEEQLAQNPLPTNVTGDNGDLDFTTYVAIGNSISAGYQDGALYTNGQERNFAKFLSDQLKISGIGGGDFNQPDINSANGFSRQGPNGPLGRFVLNLTQQRPEPTVGELPGLFTGDKTALNNFSVPGMKITDISDPALAASNPLYGRFAGSPGTSTVLGDALAVNPTFFTFELGTNDILEYAFGGGVDASLITDPNAFNSSLTNSLGALVAAGAKGVVMNIPLILTAPYFRAVPYNAVPLDATTAATLNTAFDSFHQVLDAIVGHPAIAHDAADADRRRLNFVAGQNPLLIFDRSLEDLGPKFDLLGLPAAQRAALEPYRQSRPAVQGDLPLLSAATEIQRDILGNGQLLSGISYPIGDEFVLTGTEQQSVVFFRATFNQIISGVVQGINQGAGELLLAHYNVNVQFADLVGLNGGFATALALGADAVAAADGVQGYVVNGVSLTPDFSPNGVFSTDGIHPNPRGHAIITNGIIDVINEAFDADIPKVNVLAKRSILAIN